MDVEQRARGADEYELSLAESLRQLAEAEWTLSAELMPDDARQVLFNAAGLLAFNHHHVEAGLATIRLQSDFIKAMGDAMRGAGCEFDPEECKVVNTLADRLRMESAQTEGHVVVTRNEAGQAVAVTRQDDEGRILSVIAEFEMPDGCVDREDLLACMDRAFYDGMSKAQPQIPEGYALVPMEPTKEMLDAGYGFDDGYPVDPGLYRAMLAARPEGKP
jgi:hypothetical protein